MTNISAFINENQGKDVPNFKGWEIYYSFDSKDSRPISANPFIINPVEDGLVAKFINHRAPFITGNGWEGIEEGPEKREKMNYLWRNLGDSPSVKLIENNYLIAKGLEESGVSVPRPIGLRLVKNVGLNIYHPAFVMQGVRDELSMVTDEDKIKEIFQRYEEMLLKSKEHGFKPLWEDSSRKKGFLYDKDQDMLYMVGLSSWIKE